jgi:hypothetical protein
MDIPGHSHRNSRNYCVRKGDEPRSDRRKLLGRMADMCCWDEQIVDFHRHVDCTWIAAVDTEQGCMGHEQVPPAETDVDIHPTR